MNLKDIIRRGWYLAVNDAGTGAPIDPDNPDLVTSDTDVTETDSSTETPVAKAPETLTAQQVEERAYAATQRALDDARAKYDQQQALARRQAEQAARPAAAWNPEVSAIDALDMREDLYEEAVSLLPEDAPREVKDDIRKHLRTFKTAEALANARTAGLHQLMADAAYGKAVREGKVGRNTAQVRVEPATNAPAPALSAGIAQELAEIEATLGIKFSKEDRAAFARDYQR